MYLFSLALRKLPEGHKSTPASVRDGGIVLVSMPLTMLIQAQLSNPYGCKIATLSMAAEVTGTSCQARGVANLSCAGEHMSDEELVSNKDFLLLFFHPEAAHEERGRRLLRQLRDRIGGLIIDEVHLGLSNHWEVFRPGMMRKVMNIKAYMGAGAPLAVFSATLTEEELKDVITIAGRKKTMAVVASGPLHNNTKICILKRPSSQVPVLGDDDAKGREVPGLLHLLRRLVLDKFVAAVKAGLPFHKTIIFFKTSYQMCEINGWLITQLGNGCYDSSPFCMNHSSVSRSGQAVMKARLDSYLLFLTTSRMQFGIDVPGIRQIIMVTVVNRGLPFSSQFSLKWYKRRVIFQ